MKPNPLSEDDVNKIVEHYGAGHSIKTLSRTYNVTEVRIRRLLVKQEIRIRSMSETKAVSSKIRPNKWKYKPEAA